MWLFSLYRGSAIAKIVGNNAVGKPTEFDPVVKMWVFEEQINGEKLTHIINTQHENVKYLKGIKLPEKVVSLQFNFKCYHICTSLLGLVFFIFG